MIAPPWRNIGPFPARLHAPQFCTLGFFLPCDSSRHWCILFIGVYLRMLSEVIEIIFNFNNINRKYRNV
jgi:hypothetical protein